MQFVIEKYPFNKDCALAITVDDLHPEGSDNLNKLDFGFNFSGNFWNRIKQTKDAIKEIKFTIFTVANWIDREDYPCGIFFPLRKIYRKKQSYPVDKFKLDNPDYKNWIKNLNKLSSDGSIEYALHGYYHHNACANAAHSQEFLNLDNEVFEERINLMKDAFQRSGLNYSKGIRPPGWGLNEEKIRILKQEGISYIAASSDFKTSIEDELTANAGLKDVSLYEPQTVEGVINFNANCYPHQYNRAVEIAKRNGIVIIHCHIAPTVYDLKYVDRNFVSNIEKIVREIKCQAGSTIWFATLNEIAEYTKAIKNVEISRTSDKIYITNNNKHEIKGLTLSANNQKYIIDEIKPNQKFELDINAYKLEPVKVSAILTVYNGENNVLPSLQSLCDQNYHNLEIIVVNDGSTDRTAEILRNYINEHTDSRIQLINQANGGRSKARNAGFRKSSGEIITFCEDDALYTKDYIKDCIAHFTKDNKMLGGVIGPHYVWNRNDSLNTITKDIERRRNFDNYKPKSCWFYRREVFESTGLFKENLELVEDVEPAIILAKAGYHFEYEPKAIWLHKEPASLTKYLRRKYRGGIGMNLLRLTGLRKTIVPPFYMFAALFGLTTLIALFIISPFTLFIGILFLPLILVLIRFKTFVASIRLSPDPTYIVLMSIYMEYLWWIATLTGYIRGTRMSLDQINKLLKGR